MNKHFKDSCERDEVNKELKFFKNEVVTIWLVGLKQNLKSQLIQPGQIREEDFRVNKKHKNQIGQCNQALFFQNATETFSAVVLVYMKLTHT